MRSLFIALVVLAVACGRTALSTDLDGDSGPGGDGPGGDPTPPIIGNVLLGQTANTHNNLEDGMYQPIGVAICGGRLLVVDTPNHRVIGWSTLPAHGEPDFVLGQPDLSTGSANYNGAADAFGFAFPFAIACTDSVLAVADNANSRTLLWTPLPTRSFTPASVVLGQPDFASTASPTPPTASSMSMPTGVAFTGGHLCVADTSNHRVLCWTQVPAANGTPADFVLGQPDMTSDTPNNGGLSAAALFYPGAIAGTDTRFAICDRQNMRVLYYGTPPVAAGTNTPSFVLGQQDFNTAVQTTPPDTKSISAANGVSFMPNGTLIVADGGGNRLMIFPNAIGQNNQSADLIYGAPPTTTNPTNWGPGTLNTPGYAATDGSFIYVSDSLAARVPVFPVAALGSGGSGLASAVLGQPQLTTGAIDAPLAGIDARSFGESRDVFVAGTKVIVVDRRYQRVLVWNNIPTVAGTPADVVIGQDDFSGYEPRVEVSASHMYTPSGAVVLNGHLVITDTGQNRALVYDSIPTTNGTPAAYAIGQADLTSGNPPGAVSGTALFAPIGIATDGTRLMVADSSQNRVLIWNAMPPDSATPADIALGQPDVSHANVPATPSQSNLELPIDACFADGGVVVADGARGRVLIWRTIPTTSGVPADVVLGQSSFTSVENRATAATSMQPVAVRYNNHTLYVSTGHRILVWRGLPTVNDTPADLVLGQPDMTHDLANNGGLDGDALQSPGGIGFTTDGRMLIGDAGNSRVIVRPTP